MKTHHQPGSQTAVVPAAAADVASLPGWATLALAAAALLVLWLVSFDNGQLTGVLDSTGSFAHELFHDGRHLLGVPCH